MLRTYLNGAFVKSERMSLYNDLVKQLLIHISHYLISSLQAQIKKKCFNPQYLPSYPAVFTQKAIPTPKQNKINSCNYFTFFFRRCEYNKHFPLQNRENRSPNKWRNRFFPVESSPLASLKIRIKMERIFSPRLPLFYVVCHPISCFGNLCFHRVLFLLLL